jgi:hypothetical protein
MAHARARAFECAYVLLDHDISLSQRIACHCAVMAGPYHADLAPIAIASHILGART